MPPLKARGTQCAAHECNDVLSSVKLTELLVSRQKVLCTCADETEQQIIAPSKAHSVPANFGSPSSVTHAALLSALRSLLITSQGGSTPAPFNSTSRYDATGINGSSP